MKSLNSVLAIVVIVLFAGCVARVGEQALIRPTPGERLTSATSADKRWAARAFDLPRKDGANLYAVQFSRPDSKAVVLYFGGNAFTISKLAQNILDVYEAQPVDVFMVDHRGSGGSSGKASLNAMLDDAVQTYDFVRQMEQYRNKPIIVHGQSLGSFFAGEVAKARTLDALVIESSATTAEDWVQGLVDENLLL